MTDMVREECFMTEPLIIPDEYQGSLKRLLSRAPLEQRSDEELQKCLLMYLKLGGEKLARHHVDMLKKTFPDQMVLIKRHIRDGEEEDIDDEGAADDGERDGEYHSDMSSNDPMASLD